jgi:H+/Cl- antiporter ClcA
MSKIVKISFISVLVGIFSGLLSASFLHSLNWVTAFRENHHFLIWGLPLFGYVFGLIIKRVPHHINQGVPYILSELDNHNAHVSPWMAPFIFLSSLATHLFGGSVGREGVGVIMGASIAHLIPRLKHSYIELRPYLIYTGIAAGFSSIFGTPMAAIIFAFELHDFKDIKKATLVFSTVIASFFGLIIPALMGIQHMHIQVKFPLTSEVLIYILIAILTSGVGSRLFYWGMKAYTRFISRIVPHVEWKLFIGGLLISFFVFITKSYSYIGIGTDVIYKSFHSPMGFLDFTMKALLTVMTISIGFKGGEVTPLFFMGATFSNSVASFFNFRNYPFSSSLGMVAIFGAVTGTPFASAMMASEIFGWKVGICSIVPCLISRLFMGHRSLYRH